MKSPAKIFNDIHAILRTARQKAYSAVNFAMVEAYWQIGRRIIEEGQKGKERAEYGTKLIYELATRLTAEFGKGFTETNLKYFHQFFIAFSNRKIQRAV